MQNNLIFLEITAKTGTYAYFLFIEFLTGKLLFALPTE